MEIKLYPKSEIQDLINNARNGATIIIPSGVHYVYPDFNTDSTVGMTINYKSDITIVGEIDSEIRLKWYNADIFYIHESNNISIKTLELDTITQIGEIIKNSNLMMVSKILEMPSVRLGEN